MINRFKLRMLLVIFIVAAAGLAMQSGENSRQIVEPFIKFVLKDYGVEQKAAAFISNLREAGQSQSVPVQSSGTLKAPCEFVSIDKKYGWHWNQSLQKQEFYPGINLTVRDNTLVKPVLEGQIVEIDRDETGRTILLKHSENLYSFYGGLKEVLVENDDRVNSDNVLGKTGKYLYVEIRNQDGPQNLNYIFE